MGLISLPLILFLILDVRRFVKVRDYYAHDYAHVPVAQFQRWKRLEMTSIAFVFLALVIPSVMLAMRAVTSPHTQAHDTESVHRIALGIALLCGGGAGFLTALVTAAIAGNMAARLRKNLGITSERASNAGAIGDFYMGERGSAGYVPPASVAPDVSPVLLTLLTGIPTLCALLTGAGLGYYFVWQSLHTAAVSPPAPIMRVVTHPRTNATNTTNTMPHTKHVLAVYYPWYQTPGATGRWAHQGGVQIGAKRMATHTHYPAQGPYDSSDPNVIDRQLKECEAAGIDTLVCSWWGRNDPTDHALRVLLSRAARTHIKICVMWEKLSQPGDWRAAQGELNYILRTFGSNPAYLREADHFEGREPNRARGFAVVFVLDAAYQALSRDHWPRVQSDTDARFAPGAMLIGYGLNTADSSLWGGQYTLEATFATHGKATLQASANAQHDYYVDSIRASRLMNHPAIVAVMPGYDDRKYSRAVGTAPLSLIERQNGALYGALWQQAIDDGADWILVNSFNQWHVGTEIEPSVEQGSAYLTLTRSYADKFKQKRAR